MFTVKNILKRRFYILLSLLFYISTYSYSQNSNLELTFSQGHFGEIDALEISKDASIVISAGQDLKIKIWDIAKKRLLRTLDAHNIGINDLSISNSNQYFVSAGQDHSIRVWDLTNGQLLSELNRLPEAVVKVEFIKDNIVYIDAQGLIKEWNWKDDMSLINWNEINTTNVSAIYIPPKSQTWFVIGKYDGVIEVWEGGQIKQSFSNNTHKDWVSDIVYIKSKNVFVSGSWDGSLKVFNESGSINSPLFSLPEKQSVHTIHYINSLDKVLITTTKKNAYLYSIQNNILVYEEKFDEKKINNISFNKKGEIGVFSYENGEIAIWDSKDKRVKTSWKPILDNATEVGVALNHGLMAVSSKKGFIRLWKSGTREPLIKEKVHDGKVTSLNYLEDGSILSTGIDSTLKQWNLSTGLDEIRKYDFPIHKAHLSSTKSSLYMINDRGDLIKQELINNDSSQVIYSSFTQINDFSVSSSGEYIALAMNDRSVKILDVQNNFALDTTFITTDIYVNKVTFNHASDILLIGGKNHLSLFNMKKRKIDIDLPINKAIHSLAFTYDDKSILIAEDNGELIQYSNDLKKKLFSYQQSKGNIVDLKDFPGKDVFISLSSDFEVGIWDLKSPYKFGAVLSDGDVGWVVEHYSGLFDASKANMRNLYYVVDQETIDLSQLQNMYWEPGLGTKLFTGEKLREVPQLNTLNLFPEAELSKKNNKLFVDVNERGGGIGKISILVNGKEVLEDIRPYKQSLSVTHLNLLNQKKKISRYVVPLDSLSHLFQVNESLNDITVVLENENGSLSGRGLTIRHKSNAIDKVIPSFYGIVVGVSDYRGINLDLKYAASDADKIASSIQQSASYLFGEDHVRVDLFSSNNEQNFQPTKANIENSFKEIGKVAQPSDILFVFLAGHGMSEKTIDGDEDFYFLTKDMLSADLTDQTLKKNYTISGKEWLEWMKEIPITKQVFVMDACNAGKFAETIVAMRNLDDESIRLRALERVRSRSGMFLLAGSAADKVSYESSLYGQGLLTYSILDYMKRGALRNGEFIDVQMMFSNAVDEVPRLAERFGAYQQPEMRIPQGGDSFDIGRLTPEIKNKIIISSDLSRVSSSQIEDDSTWVDGLNLSSLFDQKLFQLSEGFNSGRSSITFSPNAKGQDVYKLKGRYHFKNNEIILTLKIVSNGTILFQSTYSSVNKDEILDESLNDVIKFFQDI